MREFSDNALMERVSRGDASCLGLLFERYHQRVYNYFLKMTAKPAESEDLAQDVFYRVLKYRRAYAPTTAFRVWLFSVARNVGRDHFGKRGPEAPLDSCPEPACMGVQARALDAAEDLGALRQAFARLSFEKKEALILSRFECMKYEEIAQLTGASVSAVKVRVHRALNELRAMMDRPVREKAG